MTITRAMASDLDAICALETQGFDHAMWGPRAWADEIEGEDRGVFVAREDGDVLGVATFSSVFEIAELLRVVVAPDHRREGIGTALLGAGYHWASEREAETLMLEVEDGNEPAQAMYAALGFTPISRRADYYGQGLDAVVMSRDIEAIERDIA